MAEKIKFKTNIPDGYFENGIMEANEVNEKFNQAFDQIKVFYMFMYEDKKFMHFKHILYILESRFIFKGLQVTKCDN